MKVKTSALIGPALNWVVGTCEGRKPSYYEGVMRATAHPEFPNSPTMFGPQLNYPTDWEQGGPLIEREEISVICRHWVTEFNWWATSSDKPEQADELGYFGPTPLVAAMRCYVASKLGDEVDIPNELMGGN